MELAFRYDSRVLVEQGVNAREVGLVSWVTTMSKHAARKLSKMLISTTMTPSIVITGTMDIPAKISDDVVAVMRQMQKRPSIIGLGLSRCVSSIQIREKSSKMTQYHARFHPVVYVPTTFGTIWNQLPRTNRAFGGSCQGKF